jgi:hypothetical protein
MMATMMAQNPDSGKEEPPADAGDAGAKAGSKEPTPSSEGNNIIKKIYNHF